MIKEAIVKIVNKEDLTYKEAYDVMNEIMNGETSPTQNAAFLAALSTKSARAETTDEIAGCAAAMREHALKVETDMDLFVPMGHRQPMYCSAMGRIMLAYMPEAKAEDILKRSNREKRTPDTKVGVDEIMQELKKERQQGICLLVNELAYGKGSVAAPILDRDRNPVAAISVSTSANALSQPQREAELKKAIKITASRISGRLGYYPY